MPRTPADMDARPMVAFDPPTRNPFPAERVSPLLPVSVVVATLANVLAPLKYGMFPCTAAVDVLRPMNEMAEPDTDIGNVPEMELSLLLNVLQSVDERRPVTVAEEFWKSVDVATKVGVPAPPVPFARTVLAPAVAAYEVVLPVDVMTPVRFAFVVTVAALPLMFILIGVDVETDAKVFAPVAYKRPEAAEIFDEVAIPPHVRLGVEPPEEMIGQVPVTAVTPETAEDVAMNASPPVTFDHPRTCPPTPVP